MFFSKLFLRGFGKFNNTGLALKKGINVVTSEEEGKSDSVRAFLLGMLFGIPQRSGITKVRSGYQSYKPVKGSDYSGTAYLNDEDKSYLIERDFLGTGKTSVLDVQSGREIRLSQTNSLTGAVLNADRNTYIDEKVITELEADSSDEASRKFEKYLQNMMVTGTSSIDYETSKRYLMAEKKKNVSKPLVRRLNQLDRAMSKYDGVDEKIDQIEAELKKLNEDFIIEAEKRKRVARRLVENEDGSVTYTMSKKAFKTFTEETKKAVEESLNSLSTDFPCVKSVEYNDDFSSIKLKVNKAEYEDGLNFFVVYSAGLQGQMYQAYTGTPQDKLNVVVTVVDENGNTIESATYPTTEE